MYKKIYLYLWIHPDYLQEAKKEIKTFNFLEKESDILNVWDYCKKMYENDSGVMNNIYSQELYLFISYLNSRFNSDLKVEFLFDVSMFIFNDKLFIVDNSDIKELDINEVLFCTFRGNVSSPFFHILKKLLKKFNSKFRQTNDLKNILTGKWKFYGIESLYYNRDRFIWDIIIPYNLKKENNEIFLSYVKNNFDKEIVIKDDISYAWKWVWMVDLENYNDFQEKKLNTAIFTNSNISRNIYITPYKDFIEEYRIYFTKFNWNIKIYSIKSKKILSTRQHVLNAPWFKYYTDVQIQWNYIKNFLWETKYKDILDISYKYIEILEFTTWTLEFWKTKDWRYIFFEVNSMWTTLCYSWEDELNMTNFYTDIFDNILYWDEE